MDQWATDCWIGERRLESMPLARIWRQISRPHRVGSSNSTVKPWHTRIYRMPFVNAEVGPWTSPIFEHHMGIAAIRTATHANRNGGCRLRSSPTPADNRSAMLRLGSAGVQGRGLGERDGGGWAVTRRTGGDAGNAQLRRRGAT